MESATSLTPLTPAKAVSCFFHQSNTIKGPERDMTIAVSWGRDQI